MPAIRVIDQFLELSDVDQLTFADGYVPQFDESTGKFVGVVKATDVAYVHTQNSASTVWTITHNLSKFPSITVVDSAGTVVEGGEEYISANEVRLTFSAAFSGKAYLN